MEIYEVRRAVSVGGLFGALVWLIAFVLAASLFGLLGMVGAIIFAIILRAMRPKRFIIDKER